VTVALATLRGTVSRIDVPTRTVKADTEIGPVRATVLPSVHTPRLGDTVLLLGGSEGWAVIDSWSSPS